MMLRTLSARRLGARARRLRDRPELCPQPMSAAAAAPFVSAPGSADRVGDAARGQLVAALRRSGARRPGRRRAGSEHRHPRRGRPSRQGSCRPARGARRRASRRSDVERQRPIWPALRARRPGREADRRAVDARAGRRLRSRPVRPGQPQHRSGARGRRRGRRRTPTPSASRSSPRPSAPMPTPPRRPSGSRSPQRIVDLLDQSLALTERRHQVGLATGLDTARIATLRDQRQAEIPLLQAERQAALFRLATLTGRAPRELPAASRRAHDVAAPGPADPGRRRRRHCSPAGRTSARPSAGLAAATARIGVATADLYPAHHAGRIGRVERSRARQFVRRQSADLAARPADQLDRQPERRPRSGRRSAGRHPGGARDLRRHRSARAPGDRNRALQLPATLNRRDALQPARDQAEAAARITRARQREGDISSLELLDAERTAADAEAALAEADARIATAQVDLFKALGGGW